MPMHRTATYLLSAAGALVAAILVGRVGAAEPLLFVALLGASLAVVAALMARRAPISALHVAVFAILAAGIKFRMRDPTASLDGELDAQVLLELALFAAAGLVAIGVLAALRQATRDGRRRAMPLSALEWMLAGYVAMAAASVLWSPAPVLTTVRAAQLATLLFLTMVLRRTVGPTRLLDVIALPLVAYVLVCAVLAKCFWWAKGTQVDYLGFHRFSWFAVHPITAATAAAAAALFVIVDLVFAEDRWRLRRLGIPAWMLLPPLVAIMAVTNSRGPLLAFVAAICALVMLRSMGAIGGSLIVAVGAGVLLLFVTTGLTPAELIGRLGASGGPLATLLLRGQTADEVSGLTGRTELWQAAERIISANWLIGVGYQGSRGLLLAVEAWAAYAHNAFLQTMLDLGVIGTALLWIPLLAPLFAGSLREGAADREVLRGRAAALTMAVFLLVNSVSSESFAAAPSIENLLAFGCILAVERRATRAVHVAAPRVPDAGAHLVPDPA